MIFKENKNGLLEQIKPANKYIFIFRQKRNGDWVPSPLDNEIDFYDDKDLSIVLREAEEIHPRSKHKVFKMGYVEAFSEKETKT